MPNTERVTCSYENGRVCGKTATVVYTDTDPAGRTWTSCNGHRIATANMVAELFPNVVATRVELPR